MARTPRTTAAPDGEQNNDLENQQENEVVEGDNGDPSGAEAQNGLDGGSQTGLDDEQQEPELDDGVAVPSDAALDAIDELEAESAVRDNQAIADSETKLMHLVASYPITTPNEHTFGGFSGHVITLGDLRNIASGIKQKYRA